MKTIVITCEDNMSEIDVKVTGTWNGGHTRRALAQAGKVIRHEATKASYANMEKEVAAQKANDAAKVPVKIKEDNERNEQLNEEYRQEEASTTDTLDDDTEDLDEDLPEAGDENDMDSEEVVSTDTGINEPTEEGDNSLSYLK